jgi:hypothetical protein
MSSPRRGTRASSPRTHFENRSYQELEALAKERGLYVQPGVTKENLALILRGQRCRSPRRKEKKPVSPRAHYENRTIEDLRKLASERKIESSGTKEEIIARLRSKRK